jgi:fatty acid desaturase
LFCLAVFITTTFNFKRLTVISMKKRNFLFMGLGAVGALTVGWGVLPPRQRLTGLDLPLSQGQIALNAWLKLSQTARWRWPAPSLKWGRA